jgi:hypothetical protein
MTLEEYFKQCDDSYNYFKAAYERLTPEQRKAQDAKDRQQARDRSYRRYMTYLQDRGYGSEPTPGPVTPKEAVRYADAQKLEAGINHLENRVNGLLKMGHTHSKGSKKYNTYSV